MHRYLPRHFLTLCSVASLFLSFSIASDDVEPSDLFTPSKDFQVVGPTRFPRPNDMVSKHSVIALRPTFGQHRPEQDAVFAYAEGYSLEHYIFFLQTLRNTGFTGDVVFAISALVDCQNGVQHYLTSQPHVVLYAIQFTCSDDGFQTTLPRMKDDGKRMSFQMCKLDHIYGHTAKDGRIHTVPDPRHGRVVATSRYELYWIWAAQYHSFSWIMLLDARDAYFQSNPFANLPRTTTSQQNKNIRQDGMLYFFGENTNSTRIGKSPKNRKWIERAYSLKVLDLFRDKPTICSGSSMGEQIALETYLRAMCNEWDETHIAMKGADQGFHNYLFYSNKLANAKEIRGIKVFEQGRGIINNLGALRDFNLSDIGAYDPKDGLVYNWDRTISPVVHQWDRDKELFHFTMEITFKQMKKDWIVAQQNETKS